MNIDDLRLQLSDLQSIVIDAGDRIRVLDKASLAACDVVSPFTGGQGTIERIRSFVSTSLGVRALPRISISVNVIASALGIDGLSRALANVCNCLGRAGSGAIDIHFPSREQNIELLVDVVRQVRRQLARSREVPINVLGPLNAINQADMQSMFDAGIRVRFVGGWSPEVPHHSQHDVDRDILRAYAEFGFRTIIRWYVTANNVGSCEHLFESLLPVSYCSGFQLPLVSVSPFYRFSEGFPPLPTAQDYCKLLVRAYKKYSHYDDVFSPLSELAALAKHGGWHKELNIATVVHLTVDDCGIVSAYRQAPSLSVPWATIDEVISKSPTQVLSSLVDFITFHFSWNSNSYCLPCDWKHVCGGLDGFHPNSLQKCELDCLCQYRKLFLQHFACLRSPEEVFCERDTVSV